MSEENKSQDKIFAELLTLCQTDGFIHVFTELFFEDSVMISEGGWLLPEDYLKTQTPDKLVHFEVALLMGLTIRSPLNTNKPDREKIEESKKRTRKILDELHGNYNYRYIVSMKEAMEERKRGVSLDKINPFSGAHVLQEAMLYGGDSAHWFQYIDLIDLKYKQDNNWLVANKGFTAGELKNVIQKIILILEINTHSLSILKNIESENVNCLKLFSFDINDLVKLTNVPREKVQKIINEFCLNYPSANKNFKTFNDFNEAYIRPIIPLSDEIYMVGCKYLLSQAAYETPFYWLTQDSSIANAAGDNRGKFLENLTYEKLISVFGEENVYKNIEIRNPNKKNKLGEIDVLVVFAGRFIVFEAKSKKLTWAAKTGNDRALREDFKKGIQKANDQTYLNAQNLLNESNSFFNENDDEVTFQDHPSHIYRICIISEHYPALLPQVMQFLMYKETNIIYPPITWDIFFLDVLCEFCDNPLQFFNYLDRRTKYLKKITSDSEFALLGHHLNKNLYLDDDTDQEVIAADNACELDTAFMVRRRGIPGDTTPEGILTHHKGTYIDKLIKSLENSNDRGKINLGLELLYLNGEILEGISSWISKCISTPNEAHDYSFLFNDNKTSLIFHVNLLENKSRYQQLFTHVCGRKYLNKSNRAFGVSINPLSSAPYESFLEVNKKWKFDEKMEENVKKFQKLNTGTVIKGEQNINKILRSKKEKIGRNEPCVCGSGKKYKKCCIYKNV